MAVTALARRTRLKVVVTGSRHATELQHGKDVAGALLALLRERDLTASEVLIAHGGAGGVDTIAEKCAASYGMQVAQPYLADWHRFGRSAGPKRNARMLADFQPDLVLAFPAGGPRTASPGTWDCMERAVALGCPVRIHPLSLLTTVAA